MFIYVKTLIWIYIFISLWCMTRNGISGFCRRSLFYYLKNFHIIFHSDYYFTFLPDMNGVSVPQHHSNIGYALPLFIIINVVGIKYYCISLITNGGEPLFVCYWSFAYLWRNVFPGHSNMLLIELLAFSCWIVLYTIWLYLSSNSCSASIFFQSIDSIFMSVFFFKDKFSLHSPGRHSSCL